MAKFLDSLRDQVSGFWNSPAGNADAGPSLSVGESVKRGLLDLLKIKVEGKAARYVAESESAKLRARGDVAVEGSNQIMRVLGSPLGIAVVFGIGLLILVRVGKP